MNDTPQLWLIDTNILSFAARDVTSALTKKLLLVQARYPDRLVTSMVVEAELAYGAEKVKSAVIAARNQTFLDFIKPLPLDSNAVQHYAQLRAFLEKEGKVIGANDMLIAAHALALNATVVTDNYDEFTRVPNLRVENWLR